MDSNHGANDALDSLTATAKTVTSALHDLRGTFGRLRERLGPYLNAEQAKRAVHRSRDYAREHPMTLTLAVAGVGLLIGWMVWQRSGRRESAPEYSI